MAFAAAVSLEGTLDRFLNYSNFLSLECVQFSESLYQLIHSMQEFDFEEQHPEGESLEKEIRDAVYRAEDIVESYMLAHLLPSEDDMIISIPSNNFFHLILIVLLQKVMLEIESSIKKMKKLARQVKHARDKKPINPIFECSGSEMVGLDPELEEMKRHILGRTSSRLEAAVIHGMGGIGKTCLAKMFYNDSDVRSQFDIGAWVEISLKHSAKDILVSLLHSVEWLRHSHGKLLRSNPKDEDLSEEQLAKCVRALFKLPRYLVVLDCLSEMNSDSWAYIKNLLPDFNKGNRIILVNRMLFQDPQMVFYIHPKRYLSTRQSLDLLRQQVFGDEDEPRPKGLEKIGKKIAWNCQGLPLAIITVGNHLVKNKKTVEYWKKVARSENALAYEADGAPMFERLGLSYKQVTPRFRPLYLYMGVFAQKMKIYAPDIYFLWIAEGFVKASKYGDFEGMMFSGWFQHFLKRNLLMLPHQSDESSWHLFSLHHTLWHFCCNQSKRDGFFHAVDKYVDSWEDSCIKQNIRRLIIRWNTLLSIKDVFKSEHSELLSNIRSLLLTGPIHPYPLPNLLGSYRMLRVLDARSIRFYEFPSEILYLRLLRSLFLFLNAGTADLPAGISKLRMLQFLTVHVHQIVRSFGGPPTYLPTEIWEMEQLIHLEVAGSALPLPPHSNSLLPNLLTLRGVSPVSCLKDVLERIPNLTTLEIRVDLSPENNGLPLPLCPFNHLKKLKWLQYLVEFLYFEENQPQPHVAPIPESVSISMNNLTVLTLIGCGFSWDTISEQISQLPVLETLQLKLNAFRGPKWHLTNKGFKQLKSLLLEDLDLVYWTSTSGDQFFPCLQTLLINRCFRLEKISSGFVSCYNLNFIKVQNCSSAAETWASSVQKEVSRTRPLHLNISNPKNI